MGWDDPDTARRYDIVAKADLDVLRERYDAAQESGLLEPETEPVCTKSGQSACKLLWPRSSEG